MRDRLLTLLKRDAYRRGEFTLSSGRKSEHYVNCKPVTLSGEGLSPDQQRTQTGTGT